MIKRASQLVGMVLVGAIAGGVALAKEVRKQVTFSESVVVNGTVIKEGTYEVVFDDQTNELSIMKERKVVARAPAQLEKSDAPERAAYITRQAGDSTNAVLLSVVFKHRNQATIVNSSDSAQ
jgi:hypothetical protein